MFAAAMPEVEQDRQRRRPAAVRVRGDEGDRDGRAGEMAAHGPTARELAEVVAIAADDEVPALEVLRARRRAGRR